MKFHIANMTCGGCARGITTAIKELDSNASLDIDLQKIQNTKKPATFTSNKINNLK